MRNNAGGLRSLGSLGRPREAIQLAVVGGPLLPHTSLQSPVRDTVVYSWLFHWVALIWNWKSTWAHAQSIYQHGIRLRAAALVCITKLCRRCFLDPSPNVIMNMDFVC